MADEESEIRRMAEIADAINAILDADPVGDTPAQGAKIKQEARDDGAALPVSAAEVSRSNNKKYNDELNNRYARRKFITR